MVMKQQRPHTVSTHIIFHQRPNAGGSSGEGYSKGPGQGCGVGSLFSFFGALHLSWKIKQVPGKGRFEEGYEAGSSKVVPLSLDYEKELPTNSLLKLPQSMTCDLQQELSYYGGVTL